MSSIDLVRELEKVGYKAEFVEGKYRVSLDRFSYLLTKQEALELLWSIKGK